MLGRIFVALCALPGLRRVLWRAWYNHLARAHRVSDWTFMNYGYAPAEPSGLKLEAADEPDRHCIELYHHVSGAVPLEGRTVLEVGSGRGGGSSFVKRYLRAGRMIGVDLSKDAVRLSRELHHVDGLEFKLGDAENLPADNDSIDVVVNVESSHCYPSFEGFLAEVRRVLRPGGHLLYADFRYRDNLDVWGRSLQASGLAVLRETDITSNVITALERDDARKLALIHRIVPRLLRPSFLDFAAVRGSAVFEAFQSRKLVYRSFVLQKTARNDLR